MCPLVIRHNTHVGRDEVINVSFIFIQLVLCLIFCSHGEDRRGLPENISVSKFGTAKVLSFSKGYVSQEVYRRLTKNAVVWTGTVTQHQHHVDSA